MTHSYVRHDSSICKSWLIHTWAIPHPYVRHAVLTQLFDMTSSNLESDLSYVQHDPVPCDCLFQNTSAATWRDVLTIHVTWRIHMRDMTHSYATGLARMCDMTHLYVWHDPFICVTWPIHMCDMTHFSEWHDSLICDVTFVFATLLVHMWRDVVPLFATWLIHTWRVSFVGDMAHSYMWHASYMCVTRLIHKCDLACSYVTRLLCLRHGSLICNSNMTHSYATATWLIRMQYILIKTSFIYTRSYALIHMTHICATYILMITSK